MPDIDKYEKVNMTLSFVEQMTSTLIASEHDQE
jgi:hypothetical protein